MLKRSLALFEPTPPPDGQETWVGVEAACKRWADAKRVLLDEWQGGLVDLMEGPDEEYLASKASLLESLTNQGHEARSLVLQLEQLYSPAKDGRFQSHVHVSSAVMEDLDETYLKYYAKDGPSALRQCFNMMGSSNISKAALKKYKEYLSEVQTKLTRCSSSARCSADIAAGDLQAIGLKYAEKKLKPLFGPILGRICLPIPTKSMLNDLKDCLDIDGDLMGEVVHLHVQAKHLLMALLGRPLV